MNTQHANVLLIEDNPDDADLIREFMREAAGSAFKLEIVDRLSAGLERLNRGGIDVILADLGLPDSQGFETLTRLRAAAPEMPIVALTGSVADTLGVEALQQGAQDYLVKGEVDGSLLARVLRYAIERKRMEEELRRHRDHLKAMVEERTAGLHRMNRAYWALSECNQVVVRAANEAGLLREVCQVITKMGGYRLAWVGYAEHDRRKSVRPMAWVGDKTEYLHSLDVTWADTRRGSGLAGAAIRTGQPALARRLPTDPRFRRWRAQALRSGYASVAALPLLGDSQAFGVLCVYASEPDAFDPQELELLSEMAGDLAYGIKTLRTRAEREQAEQALRESEDRYRDLVENSQDLICTHDLDGKLLSVNEAAIRLTGYSREALLCMNMADLLAPEVRHAFSAYLTEIRASGQASGIMRVRTASGEIHVWEYNNTLRVEGVAVPVVRGMAHDISERRQAEEALRASEERYHSTLDSMLEGCQIVGFDWRYLYLNDAAARHDRRAKEELLGHTMMEAYPGIEDTALFAALRRCMEERSPSQMVNEFSYPDGSTGWFDLSIQPVPEGVFILSNDISERKRAEEALKERAAQMVLVKGIGKQVAAVLDLDHLLDMTVDLIQESFGYPHVAVYLTGRERDELAMKARAGSIAALFPPDHRLKWGQGMVGWVAEHGGRLLTNDVRAEPRFFTPFPSEITRAELAVPIKVEAEIVGVLDIQSQQADAFDEDDILVLETLADQIAIAIHNARLYEGVRQRAAELEALRQVSLSITSQLNLDTLLERLIMSALQLLSVESGGIYLYRPELDALEWASGVGPEAVPIGSKLRRGEGLSGKVWESGKPLVVDDYATWEGRAPGYGGYDFGSVLAVPIEWGGRLLGVINAMTAGDPSHRFTERDAHLLSLFADQAAIAIQNVRLVEELENYNLILQQAVQEATTELRRSKDHVAAILDSVGEGLAVLSAEGRIHQVNPAFVQQTGYTLEEVELKDIRDLLGIEAAFPELIEKAFAALPPGQVWRGEVALRRKDGSRFDAAMTISSMHDQEGKAARLVVSIRDISPLKEVERMKDAFVSNVSHELRTPITSLKLNHDLLTRDPARQAVYIERLGREINRLNKMIEDLLRLSRLEQGRVSLNLALLDLNDLVASYVADRTPLAESRELALALGECVDLPPVMADEGLLGQALSVLLTNALNYTPSGGRVTVSTLHRQDKAGRSAGFSVSDTGPGVPPNEQSQLFQRFFRGKVGRESGAAGTGLGLAIAKQIVDRHQGVIEVASVGVPGEGTTFTVWLPVKEPTAPDA